MAKEKRASVSEVRADLKEQMARWGWSKSDIISMLRGGGTSSKGSTYERELCTRFSLWWTNGARDDVFWRSSGSGGRAMVRGRRGRDTAGQHGDIAATDAAGAPLTDVVTIEIKRGYSEYTVQDCLDRMNTAAQQEWEKFFEQCIESYENAGSYAWLLITRRDRREAMVWMPVDLLFELRLRGAFASKPWPFISMSVELRNSNKAAHAHRIAGMTLDDFFLGVKPSHIIKLSQEE